MSFILPLLYIVCSTYSLSLFIKRKFFYVLPFTFIISAIILYITGLIFHTFLFGKIICIALGLLFPLKLLKEKTTFKEIKEKYITKELLIFIFVYLIIFIFDFNRFFTRWDELSHWGKMVKEMFRLDDFYSVSNTHLLVHTDYPPMISLMEYLYCFISGGFKETYLIRCLHLFSATLIVSCLTFNKEDKKSHNLFKIGLIILFTYLLTFLFDSVIVINSIYIDYPLALFVSVLLYHVINLKKYDLTSTILLSLAFIFLLLMKQVTLAFYLMILFAYLFMVILKKIHLSKKQIVLSILLLLIIPIAFFLTWNSYIKDLGIVGQFNLSDIKISSFLDILRGNGETWQLETIKNFFLALFNKSLLNSKLSLSYIQFFIIISFLLYLLYHNLKDKEKNKTILSLAVTLGIGYFGYMALMLLLYVYSFGPIEGPELASFERYMGTYILICLYTCLFIYLKQNNITLKNSKKYITVLFVLSLLINPLSYAKLRPDLILLNNNFYNCYKSASALIDKNVELDDKVFIIDQVEKNGAVFYINYFSDKITTNLLNYALVTNSTNTEENFNAYYLPYLKIFKYLYTYSLDDELIRDYRFLSNNPLKENTLYKINLNGSYYLEEIESL